MAEELYKVERDVVKRATGPWRDNVAQVKEWVMMAYAPYIGAKLTQEEAALITYEVLVILGKLKVNAEMDQIILQAVLQAHAIGRKIALEGSDKDVIPGTAVSPESERAVLGMSQRAEDAISKARENLKDAVAVSTFDGLVGALKPVFDSPVQIERATTWAINHVKNKAIADVAQQTGEKVMWVSERSSCLHCAAYAGVTATAEGFPKGLTFMDKPLESPKGFLYCPPLHPNCRCDIEIGLSDEYGAALKREAVREVLKGTSLDSVSDAAKIRAAERLLAKNPDTPKSVEKYARDAIKKKTFKTKVSK